MNKKINFHTHTNFCDGNCSAEEMIVAAVSKGFSALGFSGHSLLPFARSWHIAPRDFSAYENKIKDLAEKYSDKIQIYYGYEADYFPGVSVPSKKEYKRMGFEPDYLIGSVHYVVTEKGHYSVDNSADKVRENLIRLYGNGIDYSSVDFRKAVCEYFAAERKMISSCDFDILGHPDLMRKRNGLLSMFKEDESWYKNELKTTADVIAKSGIVVEINTGAIARGAMDDFYPSEFFLTLLFERGVPVCINSDAHRVQDLDCAFDRAAAQAKKIGYRELVYPAAGNQIIVDL